MILILSTDSDISTDEVINWLIYYKYNFIRINDNDILSKQLSINFDKDLIKVKLGNKLINLAKVKVVWFRKFGFFTASDIYKYFYKKSTKTSINQLNHLTSEYRTVRELLLILLEKKIWLANPKAVMVNKIDVLIKALKVGLKIPSSIISNNKEAINEFIHDNSRVITKPLSNATIFESDQNGYYSTMTNRLDNADLENIEPSFFPSFVQQEIEKEYEIRTFFLLDKCYSMAIFSQNNDKTTVDFRNYDGEKPNRFVIYNLPDEIETKLKNLMQLLNLNTGSIDMIKSTNGEYIFLEINPAGQFGMVGEPCNYDLHKAVAENLIQLNANG